MDPLTWILEYMNMQETSGASSKTVFLSLGSAQEPQCIVLRDGVVGDVPQVLAIAKTTDRFRLSKYTARPSEDELLYWIEDDRALVIVAESNAQVLGYALGMCISPKWCFSESVAILPAAQGRGLGKALYSFLRERCCLRGVELIHGLVKDDEDSTLDYWIARGFEAGARCIWVEDWLDED